MIPHICFVTASLVQTCAPAPLHVTILAIKAHGFIFGSNPHEMCCSHNFPPLLLFSSPFCCSLSMIKQAWVSMHIPHTLPVCLSTSNHQNKRLRGTTSPFRHDAILFLPGLLIIPTMRWKHITPCWYILPVERRAKGEPTPFRNQWQPPSHLPFDCVICTRASSQPAWSHGRTQEPIRRRACPGRCCSGWCWLACLQLRAQLLPYPTQLKLLWGSGAGGSSGYVEGGGGRGWS